MPREIRTLRFGLEDQLAGEHRSEPFLVPAGTESLEVELSYDRSAALIDLGCESPRGWRGWSGSRRDRFVIRTDRATPGYISGELEPGEWSVQLGLRRLPVDPIAVSVTITVPADSSIETGTIRARAGRCRSSQWPPPSGAGRADLVRR